MKPKNACTTIEIRTDIEDNSDELSVSIRIDAPRGSMGPLGLFADAATFVLSNHAAPEREHIAALDVMRSSSSAFARARGVIVPELPRELALDNAKKEDDSADTIRPDSARETHFGSMLAFANAIDSKDADAAGVALGLLLGTVDPDFAKKLEKTLFHELDVRLDARYREPKPDESVDAIGYLSETGGGVSVTNGSRVVAAGVGTRPDDSEDGVIEEPYLEQNEDEQTSDDIIDESAAPIVGIDPQPNDESDACPECGSTTDDPYSDKVVTMQIEKLLRSSGEVLEPSAIRGGITARRDCGSMLSFARIDRILGELCDRRLVRAVDDGYCWETDVPDPHTANDEKANIALEAEEHSTPPPAEPSPIDIRTAILRLIRARAQGLDSSASYELEKCADEISNGAHMTKHPDYSEERAANEYLMSRGYARLGKTREAFLLVVSELSTPGKLEALVSEVMAPKPAEAQREIIPDCHLCGKSAAAICNACGIRFCYEKTCMDRHENSYEHIVATTSNENNYACICKKGKTDADCPRHVRRFVYAERAETAPRILSETPAATKHDETKGKALEFAVEWHESGVLVWQGKDIPVIPGDIDGVKGKAVRVVIYGTAPRSDDGGTILDLRKWIMQKSAASVEMVNGGNAETPPPSSGKGGKSASAPASSSSTPKPPSTSGKPAKDETPTTTPNPANERTAIVQYVRKRAETLPNEVSALMISIASRIESGVHIEPGEDERRAAVAYIRLRGGANGGAFGAAAIDAANGIEKGAHLAKDHVPLPLFDNPGSSSGKGGKSASASASSSSTPKPPSTSGKPAKDETPNKGGRPKRGIEPELLAAIVKHATSAGKDGAKMGDFEKNIPGFTRNDIERGVDALTIDGAITGIGNAKARKYYLSSVLS